jgi:carboxyl-terminal processing protease
MPKRNLVWLLVVVVLGVGLWVYPNTILRRDMLYREFAPLLDIRTQITKNYVDEVDDKVLLRGAIRGMIQELDPFSDYYDAEEYAQFKKKAAGQFMGIGVEVTVKDGYLTVISPIEDTPAYAAGLRAGDRILEINGAKTDNLTLAQAVARISEGEAGTRVRLKVWSPDEQPREVEITRGLVTLLSVKGYRRRPDNTWDYFVDPGAGIGYVRLASFDENTPEQLDRAVQAMFEQGLRGLIIDLRDDPGGLLKTAVQIADRFLSSGRIVSTKGRAVEEEIWSATPESNYRKQVPLVLLVNDGSASASEILAGALKDYHRATLVGEKTYGKGSVQHLIELGRGDSALKLTMAYYYLPKGERIHQKGVAPDIEVKLTREEKRAVLPERRLLAAATRTTTAPTTSAPAVDRQLDTAVDVLRKQLGLVPLATTRTTTQPASAPATTRAASR